jgi:hypothetical protein
MKAPDCQTQITVSPTLMLVTGGLYVSPTLPTPTMAVAANPENGWLEMTRAMPMSAALNKCRIMFIMPVLSNWFTLLVDQTAATRQNGYRGDTRTHPGEKHHSHLAIR